MDFIFAQSRAYSNDIGDTLIKVEAYVCLKKIVASPITKENRELQWKSSENGSLKGLLVASNRSM